MLLALPVTWFLWKRCVAAYDDRDVEPPRSRARHQRIKALCLVVFGLTLTLCYGTSAAFHGARVSGEPLTTLQRLDHVGIYLLIAGTYTPIAWGLMRGPWLWGTLTASLDQCDCLQHPRLVWQLAADVAFDIDLSGDGLGSAVLLQRAGQNPFASEVAASAPRRAFLQCWSCNQSVALAGTGARGVCRA